MMIEDVDVAPESRSRLGYKNTTFIVERHVSPDE